MNPYGVGVTADKVLSSVTPSLIASTASTNITPLTATSSSNDLKTHTRLLPPPHFINHPPPVPITNLSMQREKILEEL